VPCTAWIREGKVNTNRERERGKKAKEKDREQIKKKLRDRGKEICQR
jgi:hypothetical protein